MRGLTACRQNSFAVASPIPLVPPTERRSETLHFYFCLLTKNGCQARRKVANFGIRCSDCFKGYHYSTSNGREEGNGRSRWRVIAVLQGQLPTLCTAVVELEAKPQEHDKDMIESGSRDYSKSGCRHDILHARSAERRIPIRLAHSVDPGTLTHHEHHIGLGRSLWDFTRTISIVQAMHGVC